MTTKNATALPLFPDTAPLMRAPKKRIHPQIGNNTNRSFDDVVMSFDEFGKSSEKIIDNNIPYIINEFWTSSQRQAHSIQEISYRACFKPQLPRFFIERLTVPGERVYDPFMGRGTSLIEAALLGRRVAGNDVNPLSALLTRPRLGPIALSDVMSVLERVDLSDGDIQDPELLAFYSPATLRQITALKLWIQKEIGEDEHPDPAIDWVRMVAINRLTGHSSGFFSVYTLPPNQAVSVKSQLKINENRNQVPPDRDIKKIILKKTRTLLRDGYIESNNDPILSVSEAHETPKIADSSISLVITSPPFLDIVQYADDNWLRCWFAGIDPASIAIGQHRTEAAWQSMVHKTLIELARVLKPGGHVAFEVGEVRNGRVLLEKLVWEAAKGLPFDRLFVMVNSQEFTKTANCWGVKNNASGTNTNRIVVLKRQ